MQDKFTLHGYISEIIEKFTSIICIYKQYNITSYILLDFNSALHAEQKHLTIVSFFKQEV
jgi:hypothetical protein